MTALIDMTGRRFGRLVVLALLAHRREPAKPTGFACVIAGKRISPAAINCEAEPRLAVVVFAESIAAARNLKHGHARVGAIPRLHNDGVQ